MPAQPSAAAWQLVILAAGQGRRFAGTVPKMLAPVRGAQGLLELLLQALVEQHHCPAEQIQVVGAADPAMVLDVGVAHAGASSPPTSAIRVPIC